MSDKPSYLGLLNAIAVAEAQAHEYLTVWADATPSPDVRKVLLTVAAREGEHGMSFAKRINELGYEVRCKDDSNREKAMALVKSDRSDLKKMEKLKLNTLDTGDKPDIFDGFFKDHSIDIRTGSSSAATSQRSATRPGSCAVATSSSPPQSATGRAPIVGVAHFPGDQGRHPLQGRRRVA